MNILRVNTSNQTVSIEPLADERKFLGGRALIAKILNKEVDPKCDPLGEDNKLIIAVGPLAGTIAPHFGRISIRQVESFNQRDQRIECRRSYCPGVR